MSKGTHRLRRGRASQPGQVYFLTTSTYRRRPLLSDPDAARIVMSALHWTETAGLVQLEAAVIMPDHLHFIAELREGDLGGLMRRVKGFTARELNELYSRSGRVWQPQYHDHALRREEALLEVIRYCLDNPVRAGLVTGFRDHPFWYCRYPI
ncbi:MAG: transposase [Gammaproteobacteria bacterium]|nr:transposase [Gammaproteobacteria bacterium]NIR98018.1 transposase [Gammaproteobacteria bacterium]NIT63717.1 transposase [Gammaproteobacteria bacterium]NIV20681.1 transposase [Gammaproteobacteria bacterium]NIX11389.1 transposase [Gammaproteobacteria bacterium]